MAPRPTPAIDRLLAGRSIDPATGCWNWMRSTRPNGYGQIKVVIDGAKRTVSTHRLAYELLVGRIRDGLQIDHLCRNVRCFNPAHLEAVSPRENTMRAPTITAQNAAKTECSKGHPYDYINTYWRPDGARDCRRCRSARSAAHRRAA